MRIYDKRCVLVVKRVVMTTVAKRVYEVRTWSQMKLRMTSAANQQINIIRCKTSLLDRIYDCSPATNNKYNTFYTRKNICASILLPSLRMTSFLQLTLRAVNMSLTYARTWNRPKSSANYNIVSGHDNSNLFDRFAFKENPNRFMTKAVDIQTNMHRQCLSSSEEVNGPAAACHQKPHRFHCRLWPRICSPVSVP